MNNETLKSSVFEKNIAVYMICNVILLLGMQHSNSKILYIILLNLQL